MDETKEKKLSLKKIATVCLICFAILAGVFTLRIVLGEIEHAGNSAEEYNYTEDYAWYGLIKLREGFENCFYINETSEKLTYICPRRFNGCGINSTTVDCGNKFFDVISYNQSLDEENHEELERKIDNFLDTDRFIPQSKFDEYQYNLKCRDGRFCDCEEINEIIYCFEGIYLEYDAPYEVSGEEI